MPAAGDIAILFQTIVGAWPFELSIKDQSGLAAYAKRVGNWQRKALREAKLFSDWAAPDEAYEAAAAEDYSVRIFSDRHRVLAELSAFVDRIAAPGAVNSLGQTLA